MIGLFFACGQLGESKTVSACRTGCALPWRAKNRSVFLVLNVCGRLRHEHKGGAQTIIDVGREHFTDRAPAGVERVRTLENAKLERLLTEDGIEVVLMGEARQMYDVCTGAARTGPLVCTSAMRESNFSTLFFCPERGYGRRRS